jgi:hypothetical protein
MARFLLILLSVASLVYGARPDTLPPRGAPQAFDEVTRVADRVEVIWESTDDHQRRTTTITAAEYAAIAARGDPPRRGLPANMTWVFVKAQPLMRFNTPSAALESGSVYAPAGAESIIVRIPGVPNPRTLPKSRYSLSRVGGLTITPDPPDFQIRGGQLTVTDAEALRRW